MLIDISEKFIPTALRPIISQIDRLIAYSPARKSVKIAPETYNKLLKLAPSYSGKITLKFKGVLIECA
jgi:hypothetical protein